MYQTCVPKFGDALFQVVRQEKRMSFRAFQESTGFPVSTMANLRQMETPDDANPDTIQRLISALGWSVPKFNEWWDSIREEPPVISEEDQAALLELSAKTGLPVSDLISQLKHRLKRQRVTGRERSGQSDQVPGSPGSEDPEQLRQAAARKRAEKA